MEPLAPNRVTAIAALGDPLRRDLYRAVAAAGGPVSRDEAAAAVGIPRSTAAFHLDRLAEAGLLRVQYRRLSGKSGPGAGRPAKLYAAASADVIGSVPERHYELAGELFASAIERAEDERMPVRDALVREARETGAAIGAAAGHLDEALAACGYSPAEDADGEVLLENCPFHALAGRHTDLVCTANLALLEGVVEATEATRTPVLAPSAGRCCVVLR
ncbi:helix-turn-helix transcriptional regulator [Microbacterium immunditiarum]|uniref:Putative ArsR family transcriptional regulator n=1 Tax=Microbacterium immunditiarum TaxID=337480 RepID=A0A7Y9GN54_9MICO|nr:helix-turn-helix domain-containing protein [Microbacterium immunditiarum]NYE19578.1 putative ArsR family transcriptional regulator [Microbacterium immunditiarum]